MQHTTVVDQYSTVQYSTLQCYSYHSQFFTLLHVYCTVLHCTVPYYIWTTVYIKKPIVIYNHGYIFTIYTCIYMYMYIHIQFVSLHHQVPFVGFQPIRTSEHMAAAGKEIINSKNRHTCTCVYVP